jgi:hypothetical protein
MERWKSFGGYVFVDNETGAVSTGMPMPGHGGHAKIEGEGGSYQHTWLDGFDAGRWRELYDLLELIPGGFDALGAHVLEYPDSKDRRMSCAGG